jgi:hypothetical protein
MPDGKFSRRIATFSKKSLLIIAKLLMIRNLLLTNALIAERVRVQERSGNLICTGNAGLPGPSPL